MAGSCWRVRRGGCRRRLSGSYELPRGHDGAGVIRNVDVESGVHLPVRVARRRVPHHRDVVAKLSGIANGGLDARMCDESYDDQLVDAVFLELQIQICVGETTGTPMLLGNDFARLRFELAADLATPRAVFEGLSRPSCLLNWRNVLPGLVVALTVAMMQRIENAKPRLSRSI